MEPNQEACPICSAGLKLPTESSISPEETASSSTEPTCPISKGLLVIVPSFGENTFHYAIIDMHPFESFVYFVHDCKTHSREMREDKYIRLLKLLPQLTYQPHPPIDYIIRSFQTFIDQTTADIYPFIHARIIQNLSKIIVIGDLHGNSKALRHILFRLYLRKIIDKTGLLMPNAYMVFTGDLTDRGPYGPELWTIIMQLKRANKDRVSILRGNHEAVSIARDGNFFEQMQHVTQFSPSVTTLLLEEFYQKLPFGLIIGRAPEPRQDPYNAPYRFLFFCHGGIDPIINLKYFFQKIVQDHKKSGGTDTTSLHFSHHSPEYSGLLWTDFRANRSPDEPPCRTCSVRGANLHLFNASAVLEFFAEHTSQHPRHPYILEAVVRGHQHLNGIGKLKEESPGEPLDWHLLSPKKPEPITPGTVYTCTSSTKWLNISLFETEAHAEITFDNDTNQWQLMPQYYTHISKKDCL